MMSSRRKGPQPMKSADELMVVMAFKIRDIAPLDNLMPSHLF
jgi:hypothetical protein